MNAFKWSQADLDRYDIPTDAREFLATTGLPRFTDYPALEFGEYDSDVALVIGQSGSDPIIIRQPSGRVYIELETGAEQYLNSSVRSIPVFLDLILTGGRLSDVRAKMLMEDAVALGSLGSCFWEDVLLDCEVQGFLE